MKTCWGAIGLLLVLAMGCAGGTVCSGKHLPTSRAWRLSRVRDVERRRDEDRGSARRQRQSIKVPFHDQESPGTSSGSRAFLMSQTQVRRSLCERPFIPANAVSWPRFCGSGGPLRWSACVVEVLAA